MHRQSSWPSKMRPRSDAVSETNCVRQPFSISDIGLNRANVPINPISLFWGTNCRRSPIIFTLVPSTAIRTDVRTWFLGARTPRESLENCGDLEAPALKPQPQDHSAIGFKNAARRVWSALGCVKNFAKEHTLTCKFDMVSVKISHISKFFS